MRYLHLRVSQLLLVGNGRVQKLALPLAVELHLDSLHLLGMRLTFTDEIAEYKFRMFRNQLTPKPEPFEC